MTKTQLIDEVKNQSSSCVERGEAVSVLCNDYGLEQAKVAEMTSLSVPSISHLRACFDDLSVEARQKCKNLDIHVEACYLLGLRVPHQDQIHLIALAQQFTKKREAKRSIQRHGAQGRQTPIGRITKSDMEEAISATK